MNRNALRVLFWGTYDLSKPRNRLLREGLRRAGAQVEECREAVWEDVRDKSGLSMRTVLTRFARCCSAYPRLVYRFLKAEKPDVALVGYMGLLDVLVLYPWARFRKVPVVWDQFISVYDTVVEDRRMLSRRNPAARILWLWEGVACWASQLVLMDTVAHAEYVAQLFRLDASRVASVWVGAETSAFPPARERPPETAKSSSEPFVALFYGQFIPLHGIETIVRAARLLRGAGFHFVLIGQGQESQHIQRLLAEEPLPHVSWKPWVPYEDLIEEIEQADVCLGIFGETQKASRVIPNKVFQVVASGKPLITRDGPAIRELFRTVPEYVCLVPAGDPTALAEALVRMRSLPRPGEALFADLRQEITEQAIGKQAISVLSTVAHSSR